MNAYLQLLSLAGEEVALAGSWMTADDSPGLIIVTNEGLIREVYFFIIFIFCL